MQVKVFSGDAEKVERAINRWADDGSRRTVLSMVALHVTEGIGVMFVFQLVEPPSTNGKIVPVSAIVH